MLNLESSLGQGWSTFSVFLHWIPEVWARFFPTVDVDQRGIWKEVIGHGSKLSKKCLPIPSILSICKVLYILMTEAHKSHRSEETNCVVGVLLDNWSHIQRPQKPKALLLLTLRVSVVFLINPFTPPTCSPSRPCNIPLNLILYGLGVLLGVADIEARCFLLSVSVFHRLDLPHLPFRFPLPRLGVHIFKRRAFAKARVGQKQWRENTGSQDVWTPTGPDPV